MRSRAVATRKVSEDVAASSSLSADQDTVAYSADGLVKLMDARTMENPSLVDTGDTWRKNVAFYPEGHVLLSMVDKVIGLRLFDLLALEVVHTYKFRGLTKQAFSPSGVCAVASEYNIKLYDLRVEYAIMNLTASNSEIVGWKGKHTVYSVSQSSVKFFDLRNVSHASIMDMKGVVSFLPCRFRTFYLRCDGKVNMLGIIEESTTEKEVCGKTFNVVKDDEHDFCAVVFGNKMMETFTNERIERCEVIGTGEINKGIFNEDVNQFVLFTKNGMYCCDADFF